jgi:acyl carrier protein
VGQTFSDGDGPAGDAGSGKTAAGGAVPADHPGARRGRAAMTAAAVTAIAALVGVPGDQVATDAPFTDLGLSSTQLARLTAVLEDALGVAVSLTALYDHPDIDRLVDHLASA